jgi:hypothetical protein
METNSYQLRMIPIGGNPIDQMHPVNIDDSIAMQSVGEQTDSMARL